MTSTASPHNFIRALFREPVDRRPVWMMRQAGRYLPEYRALRQQVPDFMTFCKTPELACEVTLQPLERFDLDAAIVFSDILTIPDALDIGLRFVPGEGPKITNPVRTREAVDRLPRIEVEEDLGYVMEAVSKVSKALDGKLPLIGFAGSPWTVATYMVEGGGSKIFKVIKTLLYSDPDTMHRLLDRLTETTVQYLNAQVKAGANALMVFDSWGGVLSTPMYREFSLKYLQIIADNVLREWNGKKIPLVFFTKGGALWLEDLAATGCDGLGLDWTINIGAARKRVGDLVALQGNLDPFLLFSSPERVAEETKRIIHDFGKGTGHVFNLGHGIDKDSPIESVEALIEAAHKEQV